MRVLRVLAVVASVFLFVPAGRAELSGNDRQQAKKMIEGTLYLRIDAPCMYEIGGFGLGVEPLVEVSPTGYKVAGSPVASGEKKRGKRKTVYWGFAPNDPVAHGALRWSGDSVIAWLEGLRPKNNEVMVRFVQIKTLDDFKAVFDQTFSKVPLQDEHPEWPAEIRKAIADRRVIEGMTKRQAFCVIGTPINIQTSTENGVEVETWFPRQENGTVVTFRRLKSTATGYPALVKFAGGKLTTIEMTSRAQDLKLDK
ncbi:MAG: hypothetical protein ABSH05_06645 [Bryobacteraceae bacterium]|jgi:hypothetical protein